MEYNYIPLTSILFRKIKIFKKFSQIFRIFSEIKIGETRTQLNPVYGSGVQVIVLEHNAKGICRKNRKTIRPEKKNNNRRQKKKTRNRCEGHPTIANGQFFEKKLFDPSADIWPARQGISRVHDTRVDKCELPVYIMKRNYS